MLELNLQHTLIKNLIAQGKDEKNDGLIETAVLQIFEGAMLAEGSLTTPQEFVRRMTDIMIEATGKDN